MRGSPEWIARRNTVGNRHTGRMGRVMAGVGVCCGAAGFSIGLWRGNAFSQPAGGEVDQPSPSLSSVQGHSAPPPQGATTKVTEKSPLIVTQEYIIGPEDVLEITVWRNQDLSKVVAVRPDGRISLPLIGDVTAVGKTPAQLTEEISAKLKEYKENPSVAILMKEINSYTIFVLGKWPSRGNTRSRARPPCSRGSRSPEGSPQWRRATSSWCFGSVRMAMVTRRSRPAMTISSCATALNRILS